MKIINCRIRQTKNRNWGIRKNYSFTLYIRRWSHDSDENHNRHIVNQTFMKKNAVPWKILFAHVFDRHEI